MSSCQTVRTRYLNIDIKAWSAGMKRIRIVARDIATEGELDESSTARVVWEALPLESRANRWGEEVYFSVGLKVKEENPKEVVDVGDLGFWPPGQAICIFFGRTPSSKGEEIRPASPVNVFGRISGDARVFGKIKDGDPIRVEAIEGPCCRKR